MWAAPPLKQWSPCIPYTQFTTTNIPATMCLPISFPVPFTTTKRAADGLSTCVLRKFQLYSQLKNLNLDNNSTTNVGNLVAAVKSGSVMEQNTKKTRGKHRQQGAKEEVVEEEKQGDSKKLSGFDVLHALEKATAQKMKKKRNGRDSNKNVGALSIIKEDWGSRLDELEKKNVKSLWIQLLLEHNCQVIYY
ncbi:hypothetical protein RND71_015545 [Anisodus tanguticus]|uniref:Uncharacterized protein n=1 Tax=Anisodus tanguticus TaxID=243964 RepID=A0AAE1S7B3_9SOLA|nr:hypothetical protein RND71_015545 [Anisodus tanguticus]